LTTIGHLTHTRRIFILPAVSIVGGRGAGVCFYRSGGGAGIPRKFVAGLKRPPIGADERFAVLVHPVQVAVDFRHVADTRN